MKPVLIVGATGVFGSRLVEQIAATKTADHIILAGRDKTKATALLSMLKSKNIVCSFETFDRDKPDARRLKEIAPSVVIDAAGPFQNENMQLPQAAIDAGIDYIDLADARHFVANISKLAVGANRSGVRVISGASSTPALSHAVLDHMVKGWQSINTILVAISPGNRAPRGLSVIKAILSYVGKPIEVFQNGIYAPKPGWSENQKIAISTIGIRNVALCETPDLDELCRRYNPVISAEFKAGLELGLMHHALRLLSFLRVKNLDKFAQTFQILANVLKPLGTDRGGMLVEATGKDQNGKPVKARWTLVAETGTGPNVPILPALVLLQKLQTLTTGARSAAGEMAYQDIEPHFKRLNIKTTFTQTNYPTGHLFQKALGADWHKLPAVTRAVHQTAPSLLLTGEANVQGADNRLGQLIAHLFGFAKQGRNLPLRTVIVQDGEFEKWTRHFPGRIMRSALGNPNAKNQTIEEHFGPFHFTLKLIANERGLDMIPSGMKLLALPLPMFLLPKVTATERASPDGKHLFDVDISYWPFGRLVHYQGWLKPLP